MKPDPAAAPAPRAFATVALLGGIGVAPLVATGETPADLAHTYAICVGVGILISLWLDYQRRLRNLVRADLMAIVSLYFLTLFEFLLPQEDFNKLTTLREAEPALNACLLGFAGLAIGRHFAPPAGKGLQKTLRGQFASRAFLVIYTVCVVGGYFHMLVAVDFDFMEMFRQFMQPRFSQSWTRGKLGDWKALVGELGMVIYLVPPVAGIVFASRSQYTVGQKVYVLVTLLLTLFYGFTSGTRNIFITFLATFIVAYAFAIDPRRKRELVAVSAVVASLAFYATTAMLEFRNIGFEAYLEGRREGRIEKKEVNFFVDYNLYVVAKLVDVFPERHAYLGFEIPYLAVIRPIPRAVWKGKPEGMSISIEEAVGVEGLTLASSFVGEGYMSGGLIGVFVVGFVFGMIDGWWNRFGRPDNSSFGHLVFASGFFAAVISMRSMFVFTTAVLPTIAALVLGNWLMSRRSSRKAAPEPGE
jgi:hypothetical protein